MSALLVLAGLAVVIVVGMNRGWLPGEQAKMMLAVQPVQSAPENTALANRLTLIIDRMLSQAPDFHYMPTIDAFYDMESGFLPKDCLVLESWLSRNQDNYSLRYQLTVPNGEHLTGELAGINPQGLASQMSKNLGHWADLNQSSLASSP